MKKSLINSLAAILVFAATTAMAQQKMMDGMKDVPMGKPPAEHTMPIA